MTQPVRHHQPSGTVDERITHAALTLIAEHGLGGVTMTDVATTANVARQTLYGRFPDLDAIVVAALDSHNRTSIAQLKALIATSDSAPAKIDLLVRHVVATAAHGPGLIDLRAALSPEARTTLDQHEQHVRHIIEATITEGTAAGDFVTDTTPTDAAYIVQGMLEAGIRLAHEHGDTAAASATTTTMILHALNTTAAT